MNGLKRILFIGVSLWLAACAIKPSTATIWQSPPVEFPIKMSVAERIAHIAQREHAAWYGSFIDTQGRLRHYRMAEGEAKRLQDGSMAWERVIAYWRDSGSLALLPWHHRSRQCLHIQKPSHIQTCRLFTLDAAWSAAFVSYVMVQAQVPQFHVSPRHFDYIRAAWQQQGAYRLHNPAHTPLNTGDMLCYLRGQTPIRSYPALLDYLQQQDAWLPAHCDIVVATQPQEIWLIGGNVFNTVALRKLPLDAQGHLILPPSDNAACAVHHEAACNMNRQNWVAVLKLTV